MANYLYHITERKSLESILENGLLLDNGLTDPHHICLSTSIENCAALAPMTTEYWVAKSYYDRKKGSYIGNWYFWKTVILRYPVVRIDVTGIEDYLLCCPNKDNKYANLYGKHRLIPEYKCKCDISPDRVEYYKDCVLRLDMMDSNRMRSKPEKDWRKGKITINDKGDFQRI